MKWMIGIDLHTEAPQICYYEQTTKHAGVTPMRIGNAGVSLSELFVRPDQIADGASARTIADILREVFRTLGIRDIAREIAGVMVTAETLDKPLVSLIRAVYEDLGIGRGCGYIQDYNESLYYYMAYQGRELWGRNAAVFHFDGDTAVYYRLAVHDNVRPRAAQVTRGGTCALDADPERRDAAFAAFAAEELGSTLFSSIFLTGRGFDVSWAAETSRVLCKGGRRVYTEDGLFARGARNAIRERLDERKIRGYVYAGDSIVPYDVGMELRVGDTVGYHPLVTGGTHWYNAQGSCEVILGDDRALTFLLTEAKSGGASRVVMQLEGLPERPEGTTRLGISVEFESRDSAVVEVADLGFGEIFPASGKVWRRTLGERT